MHKTNTQKVFQIFNYVFLVIIGLATIYPFWEVIRLSFANPHEITHSYFALWNKQTSFAGYRHVLNNEYIWLGYKNTITRVLIGVSINMVLVILTAYPLSKRNLPHRNLFTKIIVFTMFFHGGLIPEYLLVQTINIDNSIFALVLPGAINTFLLLITRNYLMSLPAELEESAKIDGAGYLRILTAIVIPLSTPILVTVMLWCVVGHWNAWFDCLIYIRKPRSYVLQAILRKIVIDAAPTFDGSGVSDVPPASYAESIKAASIIVSTLPIMMIYPFLQKYFIQGMIMGSLKG